MATIRLIFAIVGLTIPLVAIAGAIRSRDNDRLAEGLLIGMYLGALGSISLSPSSCISAFCELWRGLEDEEINSASGIKWGYGSFHRTK